MPVSSTERRRRRRRRRRNAPRVPLTSESATLLLPIHPP
ncbi:hypothetical protein E2C01_083829 [Portunus trituberculatus]|uniref:Uncharacterized protein n=1 Tax=Portunus trituberculatus TaxID=210409 RepID=A0A5B7J2C3_PORTR|nr:hypothetical protein [Portunus trituberculatus]